MKDKINVLGTEYTIEYDLSDYLNDNSKGGECDLLLKVIKINQKYINGFDTEVEKKDYKNKILRHEIIHAFLYESGLDSSSDWARNEEIVDYFALQFDKMSKIFKEVEV